MFCTKCGKETVEGASFCGNCGAALPSAQNSLPVQNTVQPQVVAAPSVVATPSVVNATTAGVAGTAAVKQRKGVSKTAVLAALIIIAIAIIAVLLYVFLFSTKPAYVIESITSYTKDGEISYKTDYSHSENGMVTKVATTRNGETTTTDYKEIAEGVSIDKDEIGSVETNSNGDVVRILSEEKEGEMLTNTITEYTYSKPGVISSRSTSTTVTNGVSDYKTDSSYDFNEDGWPVSQKYSWSGSYSVGTNVDCSYEYDFSGGNENILVTITGINHTNNDSVFTMKERLVLNNDGKIVQIYRIEDDGSEWLQSESKYEKIDKPAKYVAAYSRLKDVGLIMF